MSKSRGKKQRKRVHKNESGSTSDGAPSGTATWYKKDGDEKTRNLFALKVEVLGPFLFSQPSLCDQAVKYARELKILPIGSQTWPVFFGKEKWEQIHLLVQVTMETIRICEKDATFCEQLMSAALTDKLCEVVQSRCKKLSSYPPANVQPLFTLFTIHVADFASRSKHTSLGQLLISTSLDQDSLVAPVKERGNSNFKHHRFRAAIADYTTAIKLCPHNPVLYCKRAQCYLRNDDHWCSCLDSYRALVLDSFCENPYYRCAEAWSKLGDVRKALIINEMGRACCSDITDLKRQYSELQIELSDSDQPSPMPTEQDQPSPMPTEQDQPSPMPTKHDQDSSLPTKQDQTSLVPIEQSQDSSLPTEQDQTSPMPTKQDQTSSLPTEQDQTSPMPTKQEEDCPMTDESNVSTVRDSQIEPATVDESSKSVKNQSVKTSNEKKANSVLKEQLSTKGSENGEKAMSDKKIKKSHHKFTKQSSHKRSKLTKPFTDFETLQCPEIQGDISCKQLRQLCNQVKLSLCSPASYFAQSGPWEKLEPEWNPPQRPLTDPSLPHKPVSVVFNEIWCPVLSDMEESRLIKPPKFHYLAQMKFGEQN